MQETKNNMPNHIKNRITLIGSAEAVKQAIEKFSTHYPETVMIAFDGEHVYENEKGTTGWLDPKTNKFKIRDIDCEHDGVVNGFTPKMEAAWTQLPDFNKVVPMPESLSEIESNGDLMPLENMFSANTPFKKVLDDMRQAIQKMEEGGKMRADYGANRIENFIKGIRNYLAYGFATWYEWSIVNWGTKWNSYSCEKVSDREFMFDTAWSGVPNLVKEMSKQYPDVEFHYAYADEDTGANVGRGLYMNGGELSFIKFENGSREAYEMAFELRPEYKNNYKFVDGNYVYQDEEETPEV